MHSTQPEQAAPCNDGDCASPPRDESEALRLAHVASGERLAARLGGALRLVGAALLIALAIRSFLVQPFIIPSGSMSPLLKSGDFVFVDKAAYGWTLASLPLASAFSSEEESDGWRLFAKPVQPGDVIVFVSPRGQDYVKRMVAGGGDRVAISGGKLVLNSRLMPCVPEGDEGLCRETLPNGASHLLRSDGSGPLSEMAEITIPAGYYFVLGDNRDDSDDSRLSRAHGGVGLVPDTQVIGRASRIFFSTDGEVRWGRIGQAID